LLKTLLGSYFFFSFCSWAKLSPKTCVPPTPIPEEISGSIDNQPAQQVEELTVIVEVFTYACPSSQNPRIFICETLLPRKGREKAKGLRVAILTLTIRYNSAYPFCHPEFLKLLMGLGAHILGPLSNLFVVFCFRPAGQRISTIGFKWGMRELRASRPPCSQDTRLKEHADSWNSS
jgi:hypothetical protein